MEATADARPGARPRSAHETEFARIVSFSDGVLAIAITLLVLNLDVPRLASAEQSELSERLLELWPQLLAYGASFAVLGRFWLNHHRLFGALSGFDEWLMRHNLLYLALLVLVPFTTEVLGSYGSEASAVAAYALVLGAAALVNWLMVGHALRMGLVRPEARYVAEQFTGLQGLMTSILFFVSIPIGFLSTTAAELIWIGIFVTRGGQLRRPRRRLESAHPAR